MKEKIVSIEEKVADEVTVPTGNSNSPITAKTPALKKVKKKVITPTNIITRKRGSNKNCDSSLEIRKKCDIKRDAKTGLEYRGKKDV